MQLLSLQLENFRNYDELNFSFEGAQTVALIGANAQGKTNILESIAFLALGKSFRTHRAIEALGWDRPHGRIRASIQAGTTTAAKKPIELEIFLRRTPESKKVKLKNKLTTPKNFIGNLRIVLFTPEHMQLISGSPRLRRQYLDRLLVQLSRQYTESLTDYQRILRQRNTLLKNIRLRRSQPWESELWDARMVTEAEKIWTVREAFLSFLKAGITELYQTISGTNEKLTLKYAPQLGSQGQQPGSQGPQLGSQNSYGSFEEQLIAHRDSDIRHGSTGLGPHRDDFTLFLEGRPLAEFGSRGECRSAVLALKIAEIRYITEQSGQKPLLLLDDVFSELDNERQIHLGKLLEGHQSIITTTSLEHISGLKNAKIYRVTDGHLEGL